LPANRIVVHVTVPITKGKREKLKKSKKKKNKKKKEKEKVKGIIAELILDNITSKTRSQVLH
jgi:hypothetical protein